MGDSSSFMAPSRGRIRDAASTKKVIRKTLPLKELPEIKHTKVIRRVLGDF